jgi:capsular exopolysaccharide synthesis family protein
MSRIFEALQQSVFEVGRDSPKSASSTKLPELIARMAEESVPLQSVPEFSIFPKPKIHLVAISDRFSLGAEKLRSLSARLKYIQLQRSIKKLLITSSISGEGKTTIAANLSVILSQQRQKTLVIDGDLHQPALGELFGVASRPGLSDWWRQKQEIHNFLYRAEGLPLWFLPAGMPLEQPLAMLHSPEIAQLIAHVSAWFDWVIIDSPPLAPLADASTWGTMADSVLMITRQRLTPKKLLEQSIASLEKTKILGLVLNDAASSDHPYSLHYYKQSSNRNLERSGRGASHTSVKH